MLVQGCLRFVAIESWCRINEWPYSHHRLCCTRKCASRLATQNPVKRLRVRRSHFMQTVSIYICITQTAPFITSNKLSSTPTQSCEHFAKCVCKNWAKRADSLCLVVVGRVGAGWVIIIDINIKSLHLQKLPGTGCAALPPLPGPGLVSTVHCSARSKMELTDNWPGQAQHLRRHKTFSHFYFTLYTSSKMVKRSMLPFATF